MKINDMKELVDLPLADMFVVCCAIGVDTEHYSELIEEMYWDGHSAREIKEWVQVIEGDCSICVD